MNGLPRCEIPEGALLEKYRYGRNYTDCYQLEIEQSVALGDFIAAFYTTTLFKLERHILRWAVRRPSTDEGAKQLGNGESESFAAWSVEDRNEQEILLTDYMGRTRSWLMCRPTAASVNHRTALWFGSAVVFERDGAASGDQSDILFRVSLPFHRIYSRALLYSASRELRRREFLTTGK